MKSFFHENFCWNFRFFKELSWWLMKNSFTKKFRTFLFFFDWRARCARTLETWKIPSINYLKWSIFLFHKSLISMIILFSSFLFHPVPPHRSRYATANDDSFDSNSICSISSFVVFFCRVGCCCSRLLLLLLRWC